MNSIFFNKKKTDDSLHIDPNQLKRQISACTKKITPISVDTESNEGTFKGSSSKPYLTSLETCSCIDFNRRKLPCKHMYRLAFELGLFDLPGEVKTSNVVTFSSSKAVDVILDKDTGEIFENINKDGAKEKLHSISPESLLLLKETLYTFVYSKKNAYFTLLKDQASEILDTQICLSEDYDGVSKIQHAFQQDLDEIIKLLGPELTKDLPKSARTQTIRKFFRTNLIDEVNDASTEWVVLSPNPYLVDDYSAIYLHLSSLYKETGLCPDCFSEAYGALEPDTYIGSSQMICCKCHELVQTIRVLDKTSEVDYSKYFPQEVSIKLSIDE